MTNKEAILTELELMGKVELMESFLNNKLLTYAEWKRKGKQVKKGEKASLKTQIWVRSKKKNKDGEEEKCFIRKTASFFTENQVK